MVLKQSDAFDRAAECERLMNQETDDFQRSRYRSLKEMWINLANESPSMSPEEFNRQFGELEQIHTRFQNAKKGSAPPTHVFEHLKKNKGSFTPEELTVLNSAFDAAWRAVAHRFVENIDAAREVLATRIIEKAQAGGRLDQRDLARDAIDHLAITLLKDDR